VLLAFRFASAQARGYWLIYGADYSQLKSEYDLGFGYSILFPTLFFATEAFLYNKKRYYIPFAVGIILILIGGSRGPIIWAFFIFPVMMPYKWHSMSKKQRTFSVIAIIFLIPVVFLIYTFYYELVQGMILLLSSCGISSRTLTSLLKGEITEANGRDEIYRIAIKRIAEGGLFGNGVFGERVVVGQNYRWGYAHNLFLELYAAFGYVGGTIVTSVLVFNVLRTAINCRETCDQMIFVTFLCSAMKLMLSDSFWFNSSFWALLSIMVLWRKQDILCGFQQKGQYQRHLKIVKKQELSKPFIM
jgi:hypothetical protein